ncbi:hypothetical protein HDU79_007285 [Rhizoclosmatium sp. JEL0117]|nr:hypothetical protein HDU79_007285 [Rhizoclosmatium sp. JEL0117]
MCLHTFSLDRIISDSIYLSQGKYLDQIFESGMRKEMLEALKSSNDPNAVVLDIGANIGTHTLFLGNAGYKVHAFEPMLANFNLLNCSASSNEVLKRNVVLNNFGLGTKTGKSCIAPEENENFGSAKIKEADKCAPKNVIEIRRLDEYLDKHKIKPYLIKVDVEGYEYKALLPALEHFKNDPPAHIFTEFAPSHLRDAGDVPEQYLTFFYNLGYKLDWEHSATNIKRGGKEYMSLLFLKQGNYNLHWYR